MRSLTPYWVNLALLILAGLWLVFSSRRRPVGAMTALALACLAWQQVDQLREGRLLIQFSPSHGLVEADLVIPLVIGLATMGRFARLWLTKGGGPRHRDGRRSQPRSQGAPSTTV